jgi:hypothetical protein
VSLRDDLRQAVQAGDLDAIEGIVAAEKKTIRYLVGMVYGGDTETRKIVSRGLALAARHHPKMVEQVLIRLVWAMDGKSGTNAQVVPEVLREIAAEKPELLVPILPELGRLVVGDAGLYEGIYDTVRIVRERCPGQVSEKIARAVKERIRDSGRCT